MLLPRDLAKAELSAIAEDLARAAPNAIAKSCAITFRVSETVVLVAEALNSQPDLCVSRRHH